MLEDKLRAFKQKYYKNLLVRGSIFFSASLLSAYLVVTSLEYVGHFPSEVRLGLAGLFLGVAAFSLFAWIIVPVNKLLNIGKQISDEEAANIIGKHFPQVDDKLLNTLQLKKEASGNELLLASIEQKTKSLSVIPFTQAVDIKQNKRHLKWVAAPLALLLLFLMFFPQLITEGTNRIVQYDKDFIPEAPFKFELVSDQLKTYRNEDFEIRLKLDGDAIPDQVFVKLDGRKARMKKISATEYSYTCISVQKSSDFNFEASGFDSEKYRLEVINRPDLKNFTAELHYPSYLNKKDEQLHNAGNLVVPEGTQVNWSFGTTDAEKAIITFSSEGKNEVLESKRDEFSFTRNIRNNDQYSIELRNAVSQNKEPIRYSIEVVKDQFPQIQIEKYNDTVLYNFITVAGKISDDYGLRSLKLFYRTRQKDAKKEDAFRSLNIPIDARSNSQNFFHNWMLDSVRIEPGTTLEYYLQVWDNDAVNGNKSSRTAIFEFHLPNEKELKENMAQASSQAQSGMQELMEKTKQLQKDINKLQEKLKNQKQLTWQENKELENLLNKHDQLKKDLDNLNKEQQQLSEKQEKFGAPDPQLSEKMKQLQQLMSEVLDEETKKMMEELRKMMEQKANKEEVDKLLEKMEKKDEGMKQDIERALEMYKQLQFEQKLNDITKDLNDLAEKQKDLSEKSKDKNEDSKKLSEEQQKLNEKFQETKEDLKELKEMNEKLEEKNDMSSEEMEQDQKDLDQKQQDSKEQLDNNQKQKASKSQKDAADKAKQMAEKMEKMKNQMQQDQAEENLEDLRAILENLITLSHEQEALMKDFKKVNQSDPRYIQLSQKQLKLKDDSRIIEDSLMALAKRVFAIKSFVTREVRSMKNYMDESMTAIRARRSDIAAGKQQFAMTSINNLALMLNDAMKQMQEQMADSKMQGSAMCKKPGKNKGKGLGQMQKQLNQQMQDVKKGNKQGRELSEELAKMAAQQEMIRKALKELEKQGQNEGGKDGGGKQLSEIKKLMEETEKDLVNKKLSQETINRQQEILTRLLESEKAVRERELDPNREAQSAKQLEDQLPPSFEKYLKAREKQVDLLRTVPPTLTPYYRKEVNEYFQLLEK